MSEAANVDMLLKALRQVGVDVPDAPPTTLASSARSYWYISCGLFDTMIDYRDAKNAKEALDVAFSTFLQPWYIRNDLKGFAELPEHTVAIATRNEYLEWLQRGVR